MEPYKAILTLCQIDALFSLILFIVENLVVNQQFLIHCLILISSSLGVALSLTEIYVIHHRHYLALLGASTIRLGPMIALAAQWIIHSNNDELLPLSVVWIAFQVLKGISFLVYSLTSLHLKQEEKKKSELKYLRQSVNSPSSPSHNFVSRMVNSKSQDISTISSNTQPKKKYDWDPLEPAYDYHGDLKTCKKISWQDENTIV